MKNTIRKIIGFGICIVMLLACNNELNITPATSIDNSNVAQNIDVLVTGLYALMGSGGASGYEGALYGTDLILDADLLGGENYIIWTGTFQQYREIWRKSMGTTNSMVGRMWNKAYQTINQTNVILENVENAPVDMQNTYKGHAYLVRAMMHFELVRFYGKPYQSSTASSDLGIPIMLKSTNDYTQITHPGRASVADVYAQVISDLKLAISLLQDPATEGVLGNKYVASAILARVYLQMGNYANALVQADTVIASNLYTLTPTVDQTFNTNTSSEVVFYIQQTDQNYVGSGNDGLTTFYGCDGNIPGGAGRGDITIDSAFFNLYDPSDDRRALLIYSGDCNKASLTTGTSGKWRDPYKNIPVIRIAEMKLIRAECNFRLGGTPLGLDPLIDINDIRGRSNATTLGTLTLNDILIERQLELAFEGHRIHDIKRTFGSTGSYNWNDPKLVMPIPQNDINTNPGIQHQQNEGY